MKKKINPLIKSSFVYVLATAIGQGMTFAGIVVFTKIMSQTEYGEYSTYYAYVSIISVLIGCNLFYSLNNAYIEKQDEIKSFCKSVLFLSSMLMIAVTCVMVVVGYCFMQKYPISLIFLAGIHSYGFFVISYRMYSANMEGDYKVKRWLLMLPNILQFFVALIFVIYSEAQFYSRVIGSTIGICIIASVSFIHIMKYKGPLVDLSHWKYALSISLPTVAMSLSYMILQQCDKVMIKHFWGADETAVYSVVFYLGYAIIAVDQAVAPVRQSWVFHKLNEKDHSKTFFVQKIYLIIIWLIASILILSGPEILMLVTPRSYWKFEYIIPFVLSACLMSMYRFYVEVLLYYKKNISISICVLICASVNVFLNYMFIPRYGAVTACYTTVVSYGMLFFMTRTLSNSNYSGVYSDKYFAIFLLAIILLTLFFQIVQDYRVARLLSLFFVIICAMAYYYFNRDKLRGIIKRE